MHIGVPAESRSGETRVAATAETVKKLVAQGHEITIQAGAGEKAGQLDAAYREAGARIGTRDEALKAQIILKVRSPNPEELGQIHEGALLIGMLNPFDRDGLERLARRNLVAFALEAAPRTTRAQSLDVLSSQANVAGYKAVLVAANAYQRFMPMLMTAAGTVKAAKVVILGAGVAGLQAIATAKRLGAVVEAFDTRPVVEEQVKSLGARFVKVDLGETGQTKDGYAKALTPEQLEIQRKAMAKHCAASDVVITTAQVFGRKAPVILTADMVAGMSPGSVVVDMAVETGGNVEGSRPGEEVEVNGVRILGLNNLPGRVAVPASQMFASNLYNFIEHFWDKQAGAFALNREDELIKGCLITHDGAVVHPVIAPLLETAGKDA